MKQGLPIDPHLSSMSTGSATFVFMAAETVLGAQKGASISSKEMTNVELALTPAELLAGPTTGPITTSSTLLCLSTPLQRMICENDSLDFLTFLCPKLLSQHTETCASVPQQLQIFCKMISEVSNDLVSPFQRVNSADVSFENIWMSFDLLKYRSVIFFRE